MQTVFPLYEFRKGCQAQARELVRVRSPEPYQLKEPLGAGAMGEVWKAWDSRLCRPVAIKFLSSNLIGNEEARQRFRREVLAASSLNHPHILTVYDCGEIEAEPYLVTEFIEGKDLRSLRNAEKIEIEQAIEWARQALAGLQAAHTAGILHRDLKPENLLIRSDGYLKIVDFGLAKLLHSKDEPHLTGSNVVGTLHYLAPEQLQGDPVDQRTDLFALAAVVYEMVAGQLAFPGQALPEIITNILTKDPALPDNALKGWLDRALRKNPAERFQNAEEMRKALPGAQDAPRSADSQRQRTSLLVLPFDSNPEDRELADGVTAGLIDQLGHHKNLRVIALSTARKYCERDPRELNVNWLLRGLLRRSGSRIRLSVSLSRPDEDYQEWSQRLEAQLKDAFELEDELTEKLLDSLQETPLVKRRPQKLTSEAMQRYHHAIRELSDFNVVSATVNLEQVLASSRDFVPAMARLAQCKIFQALREPPQAVPLIEQALQLTEKALELEPDNADALVAQSMVAASMLRKDHVLARRLLRRALALQPGHSEAASRLANANLILGNAVGAESVARRAVQLDPLRPFQHLWLSFALQAQGRLLCAAEAADRALHLLPDSPTIWLCVLMLDIALGKYDQAEQYLAHLKKVHEIPALRGAELLLGAIRGEPVPAGVRPWEQDWRAALESKLTISRALAVSGQNALAMELLEECHRDGFRNYGLLLHDPLYAKLNSERAFLKLTQTMREECLQDPEFEETTRF